MDPEERRLMCKRRGITHRSEVAEKGRNPGKNGQIHLFVRGKMENVSTGVKRLGRSDGRKM